MNESIIQSFGILAQLGGVGFAVGIGISILILLVLGYFGAAGWLWTFFAAILLWGYGAPAPLWILFGVLAVLINLPFLRRPLLTQPLMIAVKALGVLPSISETEKVAADAGTIWIDGELFSGVTDFKRIYHASYPHLTAEEKAFLDGPVDELCNMVSDWDIHCNKDLPAEAWDFLKKKGFFGMIIPKDYDGLEFSAAANSAVIAKIASRSLPLAVTAMVPNSLGPAELLIHYGTEEQKDYYLPRLARGLEIPCFALTEPGAGSDAGSMTSEGIVFKGDDGGLYLRLRWSKRYITLAAVATVLGLAFKLRDPQGLLGKGKELGITCALIPTSTPGVVVNKRHDPLGVPFYNSPTEGHDVVVPLDSIIGGVDGAGMGWRMLMESLSAGRGISLPATSTGGAKAVARIVGAYSRVRRQFGLSIGRFEGIEEALARIGGFTYLMDAARRYTLGAIDDGQRPAVISALMKYHSTELFRKIINDGMDILGGAGISRGPRNLLANAYMGTPISITVEGANILTRTLMVGGQGTFRCHPYARREIDAIESGDARDFDAAIRGHLGHFVRSFFRASILGITRGALARAPASGPTARYYRKIAWASASFAFLIDILMVSLGGRLKRMEMVTGRIGDILSWMYLAIATLKRFEAEGRPKEDLPFLHWSLHYALAQIQNAFEGLYRNMGGLLGPFFRGPVHFFAKINSLGVMPSDRLSSALAQLMQVPGPSRNRLTQGIFLPRSKDDPLGRLDHAFNLAFESDRVIRKIKGAVRDGLLPTGAADELNEAAWKLGVISFEELSLLYEAETARDDAIQVDSFDLKDYFTQTPSTYKEKSQIPNPKTKIQIETTTIRIPKSRGIKV